MRVIWSSRAERELTLLVEYGMAVLGRTAAMRLYRQIKVTVTKLTVHPYLGKKETIIVKGEEIVYRGLVVHKHFKILYNVLGDTIHIVALFDTRRNPASLADYFR